MKRLIIFSIFACFINCKDNVLITSISFQTPSDGPKGCANLNVTLNSKLFDNSCQYSNNNFVLISKSTGSGDENKNYTIGIYSNTTSFEGVFVINETAKVNTFQQTVVILKQIVTPTTTGAPTTSTTPNPNITTTTAKPQVLESVDTTINWIRIEYDETPKTNQSGNGAAVTVAVLEGLVLIGILCYFGYRTMIQQKQKTAAMNASYDFNAQQNAMRMSDIPARRESSGFPNPNSTPQPVNPTTLQTNSRTLSTTPDLVVPSTTTTTNNSVATHQDPFATLDNW